MAVASGPHGAILVRGPDNVPYLMSSDNSRRSPLMPMANTVGGFSSCGDRYVVFDSLNEGKVAVWRIELDGSNPTVLAENAVFPDCSSDGKWLVYANTEGSHFFRIPVEGGIPKEIVVPALNSAPILRVSPDGNWLTYLYQEAKPNAKEQIAVIPASGGDPVHMFPLPEDTIQFRWSPDGKAVQFVLTRNGAGNIWEQPLTGAPRHQITDFTSGLIFDFAWSHDGKQLLLVKGETNSDVILINNIR